MAQPPPFVLAITGSSLSAGKLAGTPNLWHAQLEHDLRCQPEAVGKAIILRMGHGGWTSGDILNEAPVLSALRPTHVIVDPDINDCFVSGGVPVYTRAQKISNVNAAGAIWKTNNSALDITLQTMSPVSSAVAVSRPNLPDYYADTIALAATNGWTGLNNYAGWPAPLPEWMTHQFDGLHPVWRNAVETYAYRNILFLMRQKMATFWGLTAPVAPIYPTAPDVQFMIVAGGGGGGYGIGGGGGAGDVLRGVDYGPNLLGTITVGAGGVAASSQAGSLGGDSVIGPYRAKGGGGGGLYTSGPTSIGQDGGSGGGGGTFTSLHVGGNTIGQGFVGTACDPSGNGGAGAGGGCAGPATPGSGVNGGAPGLGWQDDVPGDSQPVGGGGSGGTNSGIRPAYALGGGPTNFGGGGWGGNGGSGSGDNGGPGVAYVWYPGAARYTGGTITSSGGFTVHKFTTSGTLS